MRIDSHQHFWDPTHLPYPWMPPEPSPLRRVFAPGDLEPILQANRFDGSVVVQAATVMEEARWLLDLAARNDFIKGVVAWVDLASADLGRMLDGLQTEPKFKGVRHLVHDEPDPGWLLRPAVIEGLRELARRNIPYDLLLFPQHLPLVPRVGDTVPELRMVIDHIAKPRIALQELNGWEEDMRRAAELPQVYAKLSGMITEADHANWKADDLRPYVSRVLEWFGPDRLMFGSDWPVCLLAGSWKEVLAAFTQACGPLPHAARERILGGTACEFYSLADADLAEVND